MKDLESISNHLQELQADICQQIENVDSKETFLKEEWKRDTNSQIESGGGITTILRDGKVFEQAGVNFSLVQGKLPKSMSKVLTGFDEIMPFTATGISLVIHPYSPLHPTTHANIRYLEVGEQSWFGGGMDLTPYYLDKDEVIHFHQTLKQTCDKHNPDFYPDFKKRCDQYFYLPHRQEARGIGGIFFDYLGRDEEDPFKYADFVKDIGQTLMPAYLPSIQKKIDLPFSEQQKTFQLIRRGRYVEFNLAYDRGTKFGLETGGRTESILMSLPPNVKWSYNYQPTPGSSEEILINTLKNPQDWC